MTRFVNPELLLGLSFAIVFVSAGAVMICLTLVQKSSIADRYIRLEIIQYINNTARLAEQRSQIGKDDIDLDRAAE